MDDSQSATVVIDGHPVSIKTSLFTNQTGVFATKIDKSIELIRGHLCPTGLRVWCERIYNEHTFLATVAECTRYEDLRPALDALGEIDQDLGQPFVGIAVFRRVSTRENRSVGIVSRTFDGIRTV